MVEHRHMSHSVSNLSVHLVWVTKYRYHVLEGDVQERTRDLIIQICNSENIQILKGVVSKDHVHIHIEYSPSSSVSMIVKKLKGRTFRLLQMEFPELQKKYWGQHFWAVGYGAWSRGRISDKWFRSILNIISKVPIQIKGTGYLSDIEKFHFSKITYGFLIHSGLVYFPYLEWLFNVQ